MTLLLKGRAPPGRVKPLMSNVLFHEKQLLPSSRPCDGSFVGGLTPALAVRDDFRSANFLAKATSSFARFTWVHIGNTDLEFWAASSNADFPPDNQPPLFHGFALDPVDLTTFTADLAQDGIQCKSPRPYQTPGADSAPVTNLPNQSC